VVHGIPPGAVGESDRGVQRRGKGSDDENHVHDGNAAHSGSISLHIEI